VESLISTFVIFLREGVEASMIIAILLAFLDQSGHREQFKHIYAGVISALVLVALGGVGAYVFVRHYDGSRVQTIFETFTYLVAAVALCYTTFWMQTHARTISADLRAKEEAAIASGSRWNLTMLAFTAVGREGLETMVFTLAIIFASSGQAVSPDHGPLLIVGAGLGLALALVVAFLIYKLGRKLKLAVFFRVLGLALVLFAAGLIADAVENLQQLGWLPFGRHVLWNSSSVMSESSNIGDLFHSLLGYAERPTVLQALCYVVYLVGSVSAFWYLSKRQHHKPVGPSLSPLEKNAPRTA
jgi:high-affinity iron transporter